MAKPAEKFEDVLAQLEALIERMESDDIDIEDALKAYENGGRLFQKAHDQLEKMEQQVHQLNEKMQRVPLKDVDADEA
ncbi:MAG: exodeoxyribonuclease VII small subunit [Gammaproteobacteria bacterium AqS3]|nr:exodeoxyribonuclease VII small subunit [Gammaproteobacteria bacterium AqS3]